MSWVLPVLLLGAAAWGLRKRVDVYDALVCGGREGLTVAAGLVPPLAALLTAVYMFRASGALERETAGLVLVRPLSGSGALAVGSELMARYGTESYIGRCAAVMLGCTETTFYTVAVYFGAAGIQRTRYAIPAALCADAVGFLAAAWAVRWMM